MTVPPDVRAPRRACLTLRTGGVSRHRPPRAAQLAPKGHRVGGSDRSTVHPVGALARGAGGRPVAVEGTQPQRGRRDAFNHRNHNPPAGFIDLPQVWVEKPFRIVGVLSGGSSSSRRTALSAHAAEGLTVLLENVASER